MFALLNFLTSNHNNMPKFILILFFTFLMGSQMLFAQKNLPQLNASTDQERKEAVNQKTTLQSQTLFKEYPLRNIGPTVMGGRVVDIAVHPQNTKEYYIAYASSGVFKTQNNGLSFEPIFDNQARLTVGAISISPSNPKVLWVGTGENNSSRSSYAGFGVYKSTDAGKTWQHKGLENTQHIGRIVTHPTDENTAWVGSLGALYSHNSERGVYKTTDGGTTWKKTLFVNDSTGVVDLIINPKNPKQLWAATWERTRKAWDFKGHGVGSGLHYSEDGGETWTKISNGLPEAQFMGRIGLSICDSQPNVLYLVIDNQEQIKADQEPDEDAPKFKSKDFEKMTASDFQKLEDKDLDDFLTKSGFPKKYTAQSVKKDIKANKYTPNALATYFADANEALFGTEVRGAELYRSDDIGKSWKKVNSYPLKGVFYSYGYYFGQVRVAPSNPEQLYIFGVPLLRSDDGGKTFKSIAPGQKVHADHHAMWINPSDANHILNGNDGGIYVSYDAGGTFLHHNNTSVAQFYAVTVDMETPYNVYGGMQDNGVFKGSSRHQPNEGEFWERIWGGDGMFVQVNPTQSDLIYTGYQFGNYSRLEKGKAPKRITPEHDLGEAPLRFNWRTPVLMSHFNPDILYFSAQKVYRSLDRGDTWQAISPDLTKNLPSGNVPYSSIASFSESPLDVQVLYVGTDDGNVQVSKNGGATWQNITPSQVAGRWISSIVASPHQSGTVFLTFNGYRFDEIKSFVYKSEDYGQTWQSINSNLPLESINIILQDPVQEKLLYLGTDEGTYISLDAGKTWNVLSGDFPNVATYDAIVHPRDNELVLGTHGRSIYVLDAKPLQKLASMENLPQLHVFEPSQVRHSTRWGRQNVMYIEPYEPETELLYFLSATQKKAPQITILDKEGKILRKVEASAEAGFHTWTWNLKKEDGKFLDKGTYTVILKHDKQESKTEWVVK